MRTLPRSAESGRSDPPRTRRTIRPGRYRQARIVRHPLQPVGNRPPHPGFARSRSQHARPCGRPAGDDRRRSAHGPLRAGRSRAGDAGPSLRRSQQAVPRRASRCRRSPSPNCRIPLRRSSISLPRRANSTPRSRRCRAAAIADDAAARHQRNSRAAYRAAGTIEPGPAARSSARAGNTADRSGGFAIGAHRRFRKRDQRNSRQARANPPAPRISSPPRAAPRRPPRRAPPPGDNRPSPPRPLKDAAKRRCRGNGQGAVDHHLQDSFAAGRRQRGRDRARHLQDGDDAARQRHPAANARDGEFQRAAASGAIARR